MDKTLETRIKKIEGRVVDLYHKLKIASSGNSSTISTKVYRVLLTQNGTNAPTVVEEIENTTGATFVWTYQGIGNFRVTANDSIFTAKSVSNAAQNFAGNFSTTVFNTAQAVLNTYNTAYVSQNGLLFKTYFEIVTFE